MPWTTQLHQLAGRALSVVFPPRCVGCERYLKADEWVCEQCRHAVFRVAAPYCRICGDPRHSPPSTNAGVPEVCVRCARTPPKFRRARACWEYVGPIADALQRAKYGGQLWTIRALAKVLNPWLAGQLAAIRDDSAGRPCVLTTVPMHPRDLRRRGYNMAALLLGQCTVDMPRRRVAVKHRQTPAQAGLGRRDRVSNLRGAFACRTPELVRGKNVVVFDDVLTTGSTANELARTLVGADACRVYVLSAARAITA